MAPLALVCITCIPSLPWIALLASSVSIKLVSSSARVTSAKFQKGIVTELERPGPIDRTPGTPGSGNSSSHVLHARGLVSLSSQNNISSSSILWPGRLNVKPSSRLMIKASVGTFQCWSSTFLWCPSRKSKMILKMDWFINSHCFLHLLHKDNLFT